MSDERQRRLFDESTSSAAGAPAKTSATPATEPGSTARSPDSGEIWPASSGNSGRASSCGKTLRRQLGEGWTALSLTSKGTVTGARAASFERPTSEHPTDERGSSLWRTPLASHARRGPGSRDGHGIPMLAEQVRSVAKLWPTATASDASNSARHGYMVEGNPGTTLLDAVRMYPTPTASRYGPSGNGDPGDGRGRYAHAGTPSLDTIAARDGGRLNPEWVEALMGFPIGWTDGPSDPATLPLFGSLPEPSE